MSYFPLVTPEEVPVHFRVGDAGGRVGALVLDFLLLQVILLLVMLPVLLSGAVVGELAVATATVLFFLLRVFYFPFFELRWHGRTPGKRKLGLRVVARDGGPLTAGMVFARNLTRELEVFLPASLLFAQSAFLDVPPWVGLASIVWLSVLVLIPFSNRQRLRIGDMVAGTVVVVEPKAELLDDLSEVARRTRAADEYTFSADQLEVYGIQELQILEDVLRRPDSPGRDQILARIAETVQRKVGWEYPADRPSQNFQPERFLRSFYAAQRSRLEAGLLTGEARERKEG